MVQSPERQPARTRGNSGWPLRRYMAVFMAVLVMVAALAALAVRVMAEQDARQAAVLDQKASNYRRAISACLEGRGYSVK